MTGSRGSFRKEALTKEMATSLARKPAAPEKFFNLSADDIHIIHSAACIELIRHGVTALLNMFTVRMKDP